MDESQSVPNNNQRSFFKKNIFSSKLISSKSIPHTSNKLTSTKSLTTTTKPTVSSKILSTRSSGSLSVKVKKPRKGWFSKPKPNESVVHKMYSRFQHMKKEKIPKTAPSHQVFYVFPKFWATKGTSTQKHNDDRTCMVKESCIDSEITFASSIDTSLSRSLFANESDGESSDYSVVTESSGTTQYTQEKISKLYENIKNEEDSYESGTTLIGSGSVSNGSKGCDLFLNMMF